MALFGATLAKAPDVHAQPAVAEPGGCATSGCHDGYAKRPLLHAPIESGCDACHEATEEGKHAFTLVAEGAVLCAECHEDVGEGLTILHGPFAAGACTGCHDPHASAHPALLTHAGAELCAECHSDLTERLTESRFAHEPARGDCTSCHNAHGSEQRMMLTAAVPELCMDCHDDVAETVDEAAVSHSPVLQGRSCLSCHDPHASSNAGVLLKEPGPLCLSCHDDAQKTGERTVAAIGRTLRERPVQHAPVEQGECAACHAAHGGPHVALLAEGYPKTFYAAYGDETYALCLTCHDAEMLDEEETDEATGFRNGERNLHFLHVHRASKGRTCRACHEAHAGAQPKLIAESVPFGKWSIPIAFTATDTGGSCATGCHQLYRYDRVTPVVNIPVVPPVGDVSPAPATPTAPEDAPEE